MKIEKGQPGYIKARKFRYLVYAIAEFAIVIAVFVLGYMQTGTKLNLMTVLAVVGCLPAAKMLVELLRWRPIRASLRSALRNWRRRQAFLPEPMT